MIRELLRIYDICFFKKKKRANNIRKNITKKECFLIDWPFLGLSNKKTIKDKKQKAKNATRDREESFHLLRWTRRVMHDLSLEP